MDDTLRIVSPRGGNRPPWSSYAPFSSFQVGPPGEDMLGWSSQLGNGPFSTVIASPLRIGLWDPFPNGRTPWLIMGVTNYLRYLGWSSKWWVFKVRFLQSNQATGRCLEDFFARFCPANWEVFMMNIRLGHIFHSWAVKHHWLGKVCQISIPPWKLTFWTWK